MLCSFLRFAVLSIFLISFTPKGSCALYPTNKIDAVLKEAESYLGVKWKMGGTDRKRIDCSALVQNSFKKAGFNIPRTSRSQYGWDKGINLKKRDDYQKGDLLFFSSGGHYVGHVGIVSAVHGNQIHFIHSSSNNGKVAYDVLEDYYRKIFVGGKRLFEKISDEEDFFVDNRPEPIRVPSKKKKRKKERNFAFEWVPTFPEEENEKEEELIIDFEQEDDSQAKEEEVDLSFDFRKEERSYSTSRKRLRYEDIQNLSPCEIRILKNTIFARHGYEFHKNEAMRDHFESLEWYQNIEEKSRNEFFVRSKFSVTDKANVAFLKEHEGNCGDDDEQEGSKIEKSLSKIKNFKLKNIIGKKN